MKGFPCRIVWGGLAVFALATSASAGGLYLYEVGGPEVGLAAAGYAARAQDATTVFTNPAGMTRLTRPELQVGVQPMYLSLEFDPDSNTTPTLSGEDGDASAWIPSGSVFYVHPLGEKLRVGFGVAGYFGLALDYGDEWVGRYFVKDTKMQGISLLPTVAYRVNDWLSLGAGFTAMYGTFEDTVAVDNTPGDRGDFDDGELKLKDEDWGFGGNFGILIEPAKGTRIGLTYLTETKLDFEDSPDLSGVSVGRLLELDGHRLESLDLDLGMTVPQSVMVSAYQQVTEKLALLANVGWQDWSEFGKVDVELEGKRADESVTTDMDYKDTWHGALGAQYRVSTPWLLSCGVAYDSAMYDDDQRSPTLPLSEQWRFGLGAQYAWSQNLTLSGAYEAAWGGDLPMDKERKGLVGEEIRVSGDYRDVVLHVVNVNLDWKF